MVELISQELIKIYLNLAQKYERTEEGNQVEGALKYYEKCQEVRLSEKFSGLIFN